MVGLYFSYKTPRCKEFTQTLAQAYAKMNERADILEIVWISVDSEEEDFKEGFKDVPWLAIPFFNCGKCLDKLAEHVDIEGIPHLFVISPYRHTACHNAIILIEELGDRAYPFSPEKIAEVAAIEKARDEAQTLESLLVSGDLDFVIGKDGSKVPVRELVGKILLLYFSRNQCPRCCIFLPKLVETYEELKAKGEPLEIIYVSCDFDEPSFDECYASMPWLTLPYGDEREKSLGRRFRRRSLPHLVAIGPRGRTLTQDAENLIAVYGPDAYPFTEDHLQLQRARLDEAMKGLPEKVSHEAHAEHELVLTVWHSQEYYMCDGCQQVGIGWSYCCRPRNFDLHSKCALEEQPFGSKTNKWACVGNVCYGL